MAAIITEVRLKDPGLEEYKGVFSWDEETLRGHIRDHHPHYNADDPHTWPLINLRHLEKALGEVYDGSGGLLPPRVGYTATVFRRFTSRHSEFLNTTVANCGVIECWARYPYNAAHAWRVGQPQNPSLDMKEYHLWVALFGAQTTGAKGTGQSKNPTVATESNAVNSDTAYKQIMQAVNEKQESSLTLRNVQSQLEDTRAHLDGAFQKYHVQALAFAQKQDARVKKARQEMQQQLDQEKAECTHKISEANQKAEHLEQQLKDCRTDLKVAHEEINELKDRMMNIWNAIQANADSSSSADSTTSKRPADASGDSPDEGNSSAPKQAKPGFNQNQQTLANVRL
ncbi:hypothetical protein K491DRAFT_679301 [Lophiostoma macrostomum CBS 122681]|uniref:Uncharacterized protein n=1 Tax=Lophiostoma macrostomum CBS 122681 TaxID=1314788 RepID=A0A6A6T5L3_9PLEO|nr:hypothetical protein K491DRAFT_679301 [Lophiostoma macrostomum CBS 122681]